MRESTPHLVLCIDDESVGLGVRKTILERAGYRVLTAQGGEEGLAIFGREPVEAVILDYSMPGMHGGEVAKRMQQSKPTVPIMLLSAYIGVPEDVTSAVSSYMTKGEGTELMLRKLKNLLPGGAIH